MGTTTQFMGYSTGSGFLVSKDYISRFSSAYLVLLHRSRNSFCGSSHKFPVFQTARHSLCYSFKTLNLLVRSTADGNRLNSSPTNDFSGRTRLIRVINEIQLKLGMKFRALRQNLPMKLMFFLVGFYCATAFATVIGQTGDWDILSAALGVVVVEGIGALMYRSSPALPGRIRSLIAMFNYWKTGLSLGLFLDSFKY